ncbi:MAG: ATP cone domain-containing protein [Anaerolineae bacterium]
MLQPHVDYMDIDVQVNVPETIVKRDGRVVPFDADRIETALKRCFNSLSRRPVISTGELTQQVVNIVAAKYEQPTVEQIQDIVEMVLLAAGEYEATKHYNWALRRQRPHHGGAGSGLFGGYV